MAGCRWVGWRAAGAASGAQVQQPHFIRMYRDTFSAAQCDEVIRRFEADERKHASTTATRDKPRLRSGTMLQIGDLPEWQDIAQAWSQALEKNLQAYAEAFPTLKQLVSTPATKRTPPLLEKVEPGRASACTSTPRSPAPTTAWWRC